MYFYDRKDAGKKLGKLLARKYGSKGVVVYALLRGGIVIGIEIAQALHVSLSLLITRKIGHPQNSEPVTFITAKSPEIVYKEYVL